MQTQHIAQNSRPVTTSGVLSTWEDAREVVADVAQRRCVKASQVMGPDIRRDFARARHEVMWILHEQRGWSYPRIADFLAMDHSTCIYGARMHAQRIGL